MWQQPPFVFSGTDILSLTLLTVPGRDIPQKQRELLPSRSQLFIGVRSKQATSSFFLVACLDLAPRSQDVCFSLGVQKIIKNQYLM